jgi:hypothetical protein
LTKSGSVGQLLPTRLGTCGNVRGVSEHHIFTFIN